MGKIDPIAELPTAFRWRPHPATDFIDMEFVIREIDESLRAAVFAVHFETAAATHRALAEGAAKLANLLQGYKRG